MASDNGTPIRVLIADDTPDIRLLLRAALRMYPGFEIVAEAADGAEAVTLTTEHKPDAVLLDLAMPVKDGLQAIPEIRASSPDTKILVLSGFTATEMRPEAFRLGAHAYLAVALSFAHQLAVGTDFSDDALARAWWVAIRKNVGRPSSALTSSAISTPWISRPWNDVPITSGRTLSGLSATSFLSSAWMSS